MTPLSKSKLLAYRQCPKRLWLEVHRPDLRKDGAATQNSFEVGYEVGAKARQIYDAAGIGMTVNVRTEGFAAALARSVELLAAAEHPVFEAGFQAGGALAFADVMIPRVKDGATVWHMVEVKSSASVKEHHLDDLAVQAHVARSAGVHLGSVALAHIDNTWIYPGGNDYRGLLKEHDLTTETFARTAEIEAWIADAHAVVHEPFEPKKEIGLQCSAPFACGFRGYCSRGAVEPEHPLDYLPYLGETKREALTARGIVDLRDVPDEVLSPMQRRVKEHTVSGTTFFDRAGAAAVLAPHGLPAYFLDFESTQSAVPRWKGTRPYQQIVFQFSLHILSEDGVLAHAAFLDLSGNDPTKAFAEAVVATCGNDGPVFVYHAPFERTRLRELAGHYPELAKPLLAINRRMVDLRPVAQACYYHPSQCGSWSIKKVLPAAVPDLSYGQLEGVQDGGAAMEAFLEAIDPAISTERKDEIERQLLAYCRLDTFAMVRLWQFFNGRGEAPLSDTCLTQPYPQSMF